MKKSKTSREVIEFVTEACNAAYPDRKVIENCGQADLNSISVRLVGKDVVLRDGYTILPANLFTAYDDPIELIYYSVMHIDISIPFKEFPDNDDKLFEELSKYRIIITGASIVTDDTADMLRANVLAVSYTQASSFLLK